MTRFHFVFLFILAGCTSSALPPDACPSGSSSVMVHNGGIGWTETYAEAFGDAPDLFIAELDASGARGDFRVHAFAGYDARVELAATCSSGLARCYGVGPTFSDEHGGARIDGATCIASETTMAWAIVGCEDPSAAVTIEISVARRADHDACTYDLAVSIVPET